MKRAYDCVSEPEYNDRLNRLLEFVYGVPYDGLVVVERPFGVGKDADVKLEIMVMLANDPQTGVRLVLWSGLLTGLSREAVNVALVMVRAYRAGIEAGMKAEKRDQGSNHEMMVRAYRAGYEVAQQL